MKNINNSKRRFAAMHKLFTRLCCTYTTAATSNQTTSIQYSKGLLSTFRLHAVVAAAAAAAAADAEAAAAAAEVADAAAAGFATAAAEVAVAAAAAAAAPCCCCAKCFLADGSPNKPKRQYYKIRLYTIVYININIYLYLYLYMFICTYL